MNLQLTFWRYQTFQFQRCLTTALQGLEHANSYELKKNYIVIEDKYNKPNPTKT